MRKMPSRGSHAAPSDLERRLQALALVQIELRAAITRAGACPEELAVMRALDAGDHAWNALVSETGLTEGELEHAVEALLEQGAIAIAGEAFALTDAGRARLRRTSERLAASDKVVATHASPRRFVS